MPGCVGQSDRTHDERLAGDDAAAVVAGIVARYGGDMRRFARYRAGNDADADDAYQDALVAALRYIGSFRGETPLKHWLFTLVSSACGQRWRGRKNAPRLHVALDSTLPSGATRQIASPERPADAQIIVSEEIAFMRSALDALSSSDRMLLRRHHMDGAGLREIAQDCRMSQAWVKTRLHRARAAVRHHIARGLGAAA